MTALRRFFSRLVAVVQPRTHDREIDDEIASHLEEATDDYVARGLSREDARLVAMRDFGGITQTKQIHRDVRSFTWPGNVRRDLKYAFRRRSVCPAAFWRSRSRWPSHHHDILNTAAEIVGIVPRVG